MKTKLSYSQLGRYQMCPKSYEYHYVQKLRPNVMHAALVFGSAMDAGINALLIGKEGAESVFDAAFTMSKVNDEEVFIPTHPDLVYAATDFDADLVSFSDQKEETQFYELTEKKKASGWESFSEEEKSYYNSVMWRSLQAKGHLMITAYRKKILPRIEKVLAIQEYVELDNGEGDKIIGYVDLIADIKGIGPVIIDNKTSNSEYKDDSVVSSPQLSLYMHMLEKKYNTRKAGYIVMRKQIIKNRKKKCQVCGHDGSGGRAKTCDAVINSKRCNGEWDEAIFPDVAIQVIIDTIPKRTEEIVIKNADDINEAIKCGNFTRNLNSCTNWYGGKCPYYNKCYRDSNVGLVDVNKEREKKK